MGDQYSPQVSLFLALMLSAFPYLTHQMVEIVSDARLRQENMCYFHIYCTYHGPSQSGPYSRVRDLLALSFG